MNKASSPFFLDRAAVITTLSALYSEWTQAADGQPLQTVHGSVGLIFDDVLEALGLTELEKGEVCGLWRRGSEILPVHRTTSY